MYTYVMCIYAGVLKNWFGMIYIGVIGQYRFYVPVQSKLTSRDTSISKWKCPYIKGFLTWGRYDTVLREHPLIRGCPLIGVSLEDMFCCIPIGAEKSAHKNGDISAFLCVWWFNYQMDDSIHNQSMCYNQFKIAGSNPGLGGHSRLDIYVWCFGTKVFLLWHVFL